MSGNHLYTYGVVDDEEFELDLSGVEGGTPIRTVQYRTLSAIVSDIDTLEPERSDENVRAHDEVLRDVIEAGDGRTVVPMQFGMVFKTGRTLKSVLRSGRRAFRKALIDVDGMVELGIKVVVDEGETVDETTLQDIADRLTAAAERDVENDLFSDRLVLNRSYLVDYDDQESFSDVVQAIRDDYDDLSVQYSGPWAPYNFVDIEIGAAQ
jgi:hypothetical protein